MNEETEPTHEPALNERQRKLVQFVASGMNTQQAAKAAVFSPSYARKSSRLLRHPAIAQAIAAIRSEARTVAMYGVVEAMREASDAAAFAKASKQSMALVRAVELRAKLSGLLVDRVEVVNVDLRGALERAQVRVINATQLPGPSRDASPPAALPLPSKTAIRWGAAIAGDRVAENPEAGPASGESVRQVNNGGPENR